MTTDTQQAAQVGLRHDETAGLSEEEATRRLAESLPRQTRVSSRSYASIVRANVLTVFNLILAAFGVLTLIFGDRARRAVPRRHRRELGDRDHPGGAGQARPGPALAAGRAAGDGQARRRGAAGRRSSEVVVDDVVLLAPGDQVVADGDAADAPPTCGSTSRS